MNPKIFHFGTLHFPAYATMVGIGFSLAIFLAVRFAGKNGINKGRMLDFGILMAVFGLIGAKILHIFADGHFFDYVNICIDPSKVDWHIDKHECAALNGVFDAATNLCHPIQQNCMAWLSPNGFAFYGGFIAAFTFAIWYIKRYNWPVGKVCDMAGWGIMLGLAWGRMGCYLAGCCFGATTDTIAGVSFPPASPASRHQWIEGHLPSYRVESLMVHPTQLYESIAALLIAAIAYFIVSPKKRFDGQVFIFSMITYAIFRFSVEFIRQDERGGFLGLSTSQLIAVAIVIASIYLIKVFKKMHSDEKK